MPRPANPLTGVAKKLEALKAKSEKLAQEIANLSTLVAKEAGKTQTAVPAPTGKKTPAKKSAIKAQGEPKKRGRPAKAKPVATKPRSSKGKAEQPAKVDYLSMLNDEPTFPAQDKVVMPKRRRGEPDPLSMLNADPSDIPAISKKRGKK